MKVKDSAGINELGGTTFYIDEIESRVAGIPCRIGVVQFDQVKGTYSAHTESGMDYYGYSEIEFDVLDRRGRRAAWLEAKLNSGARTRIEREITSHLNVSQ